MGKIKRLIIYSAALLVLSLLASTVRQKEEKKNAVQTILNPGNTLSAETNRITSASEKFVTESQVFLYSEIDGIVSKVFTPNDSLVKPDKVIAVINNDRPPTDQDRGYALMKSNVYGKIERVLVGEGDSVKRGDKLFQIKRLF